MADTECKYRRYSIREDPGGLRISNQLFRLLPRHSGCPRGSEGISADTTEDLLGVLRTLVRRRELMIEGAEDIFICLPWADYKFCISQIIEAILKNPPTYEQPENESPTGNRRERRNKKFGREQTY